MVVTRGALRLHAFDRGSGTPMLLLSGLGATSASWGPLIGLLAARHRLLALDNRGSGVGDEPTSQFSIADMADDAIALLDEAGVERAHVVGNSMGGMIAQELAFRHPERMRSLVLAATGPGLASLPSHPLLAWHLFRATRTSGEERNRHLAACFLGPASRSRGTGIPDEADGCLGRVGGRGGSRLQLGATLRWSSLRRLPRIHVPTLVLHGTHDRLIPAFNARLMARLIPRARLELLPDTGHFFITDSAEPAARAIAGFVADVEAGRTAPSRRERVRRVLTAAEAQLSAAVQASAGPLPETAG